MLGGENLFLVGENGLLGVENGLLGVENLFLGGANGLLGGKNEILIAVYWFLSLKQLIKHYRHSEKVRFLQCLMSFLVPRNDKVAVIFYLKIIVAI